MKISLFHNCLAVSKQPCPVFILEGLKNHIKKNCWPQQNIWPILLGSVYFPTNGKISVVAILPFELYLPLFTYNAEFVTKAVRWNWSSGKSLFLLCKWLSIQLSAVIAALAWLVEMALLIRAFFMYIFKFRKPGTGLRFGLVFSCLTNSIAPLPIVVEGCANPQKIRQVYPSAMKK